MGVLRELFGESDRDVVGHLNVADPPDVDCMIDTSRVKVAYLCTLYLIIGIKKL